MKRSKSTTLSLAAALLGITVALTGCSTPDPEASGSTNSATTGETSVQEVKPEVPKVSATCANGEATITEPNSEVTIPGDCATVIVKISNSVIKVGAVDDLIVEGAINRVEATSVKTVKIIGDANDVVYSGEKPSVTDNGEQNTVNPGK